MPTGKGRPRLCQRSDGAAREDHRVLSPSESLTLKQMQGDTLGCTPVSSHQAPASEASRLWGDAHPMGQDEQCWDGSTPSPSAGGLPGFGHKLWPPSPLSPETGKHAEP